MLPASTFSPPNFLTPRRFECESRPLRVLPPAFLCAIERCSCENSSDDGRDLHIGIGLPMGLLTLVVLAPAKFDDANLVALAMALDRGNDLGAADVRRADRHGRTGTHQEHLIELDASALVRIELLDTHHSTFLDAVLFTARGNHGIHGSKLQLGQPCGSAKEPRIVRRRSLEIKPIPGTRRQGLPREAVRQAPRSLNLRYHAVIPWAPHDTRTDSRLGHHRF